MPKDIDLKSRPEAGHYVLCRFPYRDNPWAPGGKTRPGLIVGYGEDYGLKKKVAVIAYSTTQMVPEHYRGIVDVRRWVTGLHLSAEAGQFVDCMNIRALPIQRRFFPKGMQVIGQLAPEGLDRVRAVTAQFLPMPYTQALNPSRFYDDSAFRPVFHIIKWDPDDFSP